MLAGQSEYSIKISFEVINSKEEMDRIEKEAQKLIAQ
jgi:hypothetical protein